MRIVIVTQDEVFYLPAFMRPFFSGCRERGVDIVQVITLPSFNESARENARRMLGFYGPALFARQAARFAGRRLGDRLGLTRWSIPLLAREHGIPCRHVDKINSKESVALLKALDADVLLSVGAPQIFKGGVLSSAKWGCINVHSALLPQYRGVMPTFWALYHGDSSVGMTVFRMDKKIDEGEALLQESFPVEAGDTLDTVMCKAKQHEANMVLRVLGQIADGTIAPFPYQGEGSYFTFPTRQEVRKLVAGGRRLL